MGMGMGMGMGMATAVWVELGVGSAWLFHRVWGWEVGRRGEEMGGIGDESAGDGIIGEDMRLVGTR